ncbi:MAG: CBS domain-containing protein [Anaerolineae bacterium]|nr:CBS domain-containing protein [Anaerolineae bacterium]
MAQVLLTEHTHGLAVTNDKGELVGIVTLQDVDRAQVEEHSEWPVGLICTHDLLTAYPDESLHAALHRMSIRDIGRLPVVSRENPRQLVGMLRRSNVVKAYDLALTRQAALRHQAHEARLGIMSHVNVQEVVVGNNALCAGECMKDIAWPRDCIIASLRRGWRVIVPRGNTVLQPGDVLVVVAEPGGVGWSAGIVPESGQPTAT